MNNNKVNLTEQKLYIADRDQDLTNQIFLNK